MRLYLSSYGLGNYSKELVKLTGINAGTQNEPVFEGTRIPVSTVKRYLEANFSPDAIMMEFPDLTATDIEMARHYENGKSAA
jgi:uncharacterized protein (DUF433 family)